MNGGDGWKGNQDQNDKSEENRKNEKVLVLFKAFTKTLKVFTCQMFLIGRTCSTTKAWYGHKRYVRLKCFFWEFGVTWALNTVGV